MRFVSLTDTSGLTWMLHEDEINAIDANVTEWMTNNDPRDDTLLHLDTPDGGTVCIKASAIESFFLSTPENRFKIRQQAHMLEAELYEHIEAIKEPKEEWQG